MIVLKRYGLGTTFYFPLVDRGTVDFESTPVTFASGDIQLSKDGGAFANTSNTPSHVGNGIYGLTLTATEMQCVNGVITIIDQTATKLWEDQAVVFTTDLSGLMESSYGIPIREVDNATFTPTTTAFEALAIGPNTTEEATADHYNDRIILFTTGALASQMRTISDYVLANSKEKYTVSAAFTEAPADGDRFVVL